MVQAELGFINFAGRKLLVVIPHPDDETYGCAGTMAKVKALGGSVYTVIASAGSVKPCCHGSTSLVSGSVRLRELEQVMSYLKVDDYDVLFPDDEHHLRLDTVPRREIIALLESEGRLAIDKVKPDFMIIPFPSFNQDHVAVFNACFTALRPQDKVSRHFVPVVLGSGAPQLGWNTQPFHPNVYVDISSYLDIKLKAHSLYLSQSRPANHPGNLKNLELLARLRGAEIGAEAAESFTGYRVVI